MDEITPAQKVEELKKTNRKLTDEEACLLLGIDIKDLRPNDFFDDFINGKYKGKTK